MKDSRLFPCPFCGVVPEICICDDEGNIHGEAYLIAPYSGVSFGIFHHTGQKGVEDCTIAACEDEMLGTKLYDAVDELVEDWNKMLSAKLDAVTDKRGSVKEQVEKERNMNRSLQFDKSYISMAHVWATNSRAVRLKVGALIVKDGMIISDGFNGTPSGFDNVCEYKFDEDGNPVFFSSVEESKEAFEKGERLVSKHMVLHAEANAITKVAKSTMSCDGATLYVTDSPCYDCAKLIIQAGIKRVVYDREYRITDGLELLREAGVEVVHLAQ